MSDQWRRVYGFGGAPRVGQVLKQPELADTLAGIAAHGAGTLYGGALGRRVTEALGAAGGCIGMDDLEAVQPTWEQPLRAEYRGLAEPVPPPRGEAFTTGKQTRRGHGGTFREVKVAAESDQ